MHSISNLAVPIEVKDNQDFIASLIHRSNHVILVYLGMFLHSKTTGGPKGQLCVAHTC